MNFYHDKLTFENLWRKNLGELRAEFITIWKQYNPGPEERLAEERANQVVFIVKNEFQQIVGASTAVKIYVKQFRNYFYAIRLLILPTFRGQGLATSLLIQSRDFLESIHKKDNPNLPLGIFVLVDSEILKENKREAIWPASQMVYMGNSSEGQHIRVYYFKGATV